jgi:anthranilate phosphoribosyltransferase
MLGVRTAMNLLGPCCNPARPPVQLLGVADPRLLRPIAETLREVGIRHALVVHGSGLDEIALHGDTQAIRLRDGELEDRLIRPEDAGLERTPVSAIAGGGPEENAARLRELLAGSGPRADRDIVAINAGALLELAGKAPSLREGTALAGAAIDSGAAARTLAAYVEASNA